MNFGSRGPANMDREARRLRWALQAFIAHPREHLIALNIASMVVMVGAERVHTRGIPNPMEDHVLELLNLMQREPRDHVRIIHEATTILLRSLYSVTSSFTVEQEQPSTVH